MSRETTVSFKFKVGNGLFLNKSNVSFNELGMPVTANWNFSSVANHRLISLSETIHPRLVIVNEIRSKRVLTSSLSARPNFLTVCKSAHKVRKAK